jgi:hypothetical protein
MQSSTGRTVEFDSPTMLTRSQAQQRAAELAYQQDMEQQQSLSKRLKNLVALAVPYAILLLVLGLAFLALLVRT